jgi:hypothetical protein
VRTRKKQKAITPNYWSTTMANGWTPERRARQAELIRTWQPWRQSTGPKTPEGKAKAASNGDQGGVLGEARAELRAFKKLAGELLKEHRELMQLLKP